MNKYKIIEKVAVLNSRLSSSLIGKHILIRASYNDEVFTLFQKDIDKKVIPASTIKLFLLDELIKFKDGLNFNKYIKIQQEDLIKGSGNNLKVGEEYKVIDIMKNLMISSSNTSAKVLRKYFESETGVDFIQHINNINKDKGLLKTNIVNEHGLANRAQSTTLRDFSIFLDGKIKHNYFKVFCNIESYEFLSKSGHKVSIKNTYTFYDHTHISAVKTGSLVPDIFNIILFFNFKGFCGYIADFHNEKIDHRDMDIINVLQLLKEWSEDQI